ncbi:MAG: hypothetical protein ACREJD_09910 [Phycisphaerales bacterium]
MLTRLIVLAAGLSTLSAAALAQNVSVTYTTPALDRWMYPFNFSAGDETRAALFAALQTPGFDDRDGELLVGFNSNADITTGKGRLSYKILSATLNVFVEDDLSFYYDPSADPLASSYATNDPDHVADTDLSKPIEVWPCGYRNGFSAATFTESSSFGGTPVVAPSEGARNVFPALLDYTQAPVDMARQVRLKLAGNAMALGRIFDEGGLEWTPGTLVPAGSEVRFNLANVSSANYVYMQNALNTGLVRLLVTTLEPTSGGPGGGTGGVTYPRIYTKENILGSLGYAPRLSLEVAITCAADFNGDNVVDDADFVIFAAAYNELLDARCDLTNDTVTDDSDFVIFVAAYDTLLCD